MLAAMVLVLASVACGARGGEAPAKKFAGQIKAYNDAAISSRGALDTMLAAAQEMPAFTKGDVALIAAYMDHIASAWSSAAAALQRGEEQRADDFAKRARELDSRRDIWTQRLSWRRGQAQMEYLPATEESYNWLVGDRKPEELKEISAFIEAKKLRSEAYGRLADAARPGADWQALCNLQDEVFADDVEVQVADMKMGWARADRDTRLWVTPDASVTSPQLTAAKQRLEQWRARYEQTYRQSREIEHALEVQRREYNNLLDARSEAYKTAKANRDAAKQSQK